MPSALGVHAHPAFKLGLRPGNPAAPRLRLGDYLAGTVPAHPASADYLAGLSFGLYRNSEFGVCGPTALANYVRLVTARLTGTMERPTQDAVFALYRQSGNPNFDPATGADDNGVVMADMLAAAARNGLGGHRVLGFAQVDVSNPDEVDAAVALFGGTLFGVALETAQQAQTDAGTWDYSPSGDWGGHAVVTGTFAPAFDEVITWAKPVKLTRAFERHQLQEAWVVILPEHLGSRQFLDGIDIHALAADYEVLTGNKFPAVLPPAPPAPVPPAPVPPTPVPPAPKPSPTMTLQGYAKIPLLGNAPIVLTGTAGGAPVALSLDWWPLVKQYGLQAALLLWKYGKEYGPAVLDVVVADLKAGKSWAEIKRDVIAAVLAA